MVGSFEFPAAVLNTPTGYFSQSRHIHWLISVLAGIIMCKIVYEITGLISFLFFKAYSKLNKAQKIEWNNRGFSTFHALVVAFASLYLLLSDDFYNGSQEVSIIYRKSTLSDTILGISKIKKETEATDEKVWNLSPLLSVTAAAVISVGYFLLDLGMILWYFPALGGLEYVLHHGLSLFPIFLSLVSGQGQIYILLVLFSESTTPFVNLRWYLDISGQKSSKFYFCNGIVLFLGWLVARILLFIFLFTHMYLHFGQVKKIFPLGFYTLLLVSPMLAMMNVYWFWKIVKGLMKTVSKARHSH